MPVIQREVSVAAGSPGVNLVASSAFEFARARQVVSVGLTAAATGSFANITSGADLIAEDFAPAVLTRFPIVPDEMYYNDLMEAGDRLNLNVRNPTGGAIIHRAIVQISPVA